jgi:hypothetical protein
MLFKDSRVDGLVLENNIVTRQVAGYALQVFSAPGARIVNNTFWARGNAILRGSTGNEGAYVYNNVFESFGVEDPLLIAGEDNNLVKKGYRSGAQTFVGDPKFRDAAAGDFTPLPDSPLIDAAKAEMAPAMDRFGRTRVIPDIGASEFFAG